MKDIKFNLNTSNSGEAEFITPTIKGELVGVIIDADSSMGIDITFEESEKIVLYHCIDFVGVKYLPLCIEKVYKDGDKNKEALTEWYLNNKLRVKAKGKKFTDIKFVLRYMEK